MKQKRKVKSLLPQKKDWRSSFLTAVLLILSVALCIGSASLITSRVWAAEFQGFQYTGLDDKQEVLYGMRFVNKNDMQKLVSEIYVEGKSLYIVPNPVVVNELSVGTEGIFGSNNAVNGGVYGHVLGGYGNQVKSENVTLIAGTNNTVPEENDNAAFLGGNTNKYIEKSGGTPVVVVGGQRNKVGDDHDGVALIGGKTNKVGESVSNAFLLGGEENEVGESRKNVIVGGQNVKVNSTDNVFVYSNDNSDFTPKSSNAFYLNMGKGVGINTDASDKGLAVKGAVSLGEIDITKETCDSDNLGVEGSYQGCVVGCTSASMNAEDGSKWEMLDRGQKCLDICADSSNANYCIFQKDEEIPPKPDYKAFCTEGVDTDGAELCFPDELSGYQNVIFETSLVDNGDCDRAKGENKCVYQCKSGYHLAKDKTQASNLGGDRGKIKCFKDCDLRTLLGDDWSNFRLTIGTGKLKHNETVIAYNKKEVQLSQDIYVPGIKTSTVGKYDFYYQDDGYGTKLNKNRNRTPIGYDTQQRYDLPEHCANNAHMQKLVCVNGKVYIANPNDTATTVLATKGGNFTEDPLWYQHDGYRYKDCETKQYRCDTGADAYNLTSAQILDPTLLNDRDDGKKRSRRDRDLTYLTRGVYKLCLDYDVVDGQNNTGKVHNSGNPYYDHYKFMGCQDNYNPFTGDDGFVRCMKQCKVKTTDSNEYESWIHGSKEEFYLSGAATCTGTCESQRFECYDGTFYLSGSLKDDSKTRETLNYKYKNCALTDYICTDDYDVNEDTYQRWKDNGEYISCDDYINNSPSSREHRTTWDTKWNKACKQSTRHYKLVGCKPGYHTENNLWCIENVRDLPCGRLSSHAKWDRKTGPLDEYPWDEQIGKYKTELKEGRYLRRWEESCGWSGSANLCETDELQDGNEGEVIPGGACDYTCDIGWFDIGDYDCREIQTTCAYPNNDPYACTNEEPYACSDPEAHTGDARELDEGWKWTCSNGLRSQSCLVCKDGYHKENDECVPNVQGVCNNNVRYGCSKGRSDVEGADKHEENDKFTWYCLGIDGGNGSTNEGYDCSDIGKSNSCYICKEGYHKTSTYGECEEDSAILSYDANGHGIAPADEVMWYTTSTYAAYMDDVPGFQFKEWCEQRDGGGKCYDEGEVVKDVKVIPKTKTLYAQWIEDSATLTYYSNGHGSPYSWDVAMKYTDEVRAADAMEAETYNSLKWHNFVKWCTYSNGDGDCYPVGRVVKNKNVEPSDMELYAQWASCKGGFLNAHPVMGIGNSTLDITSTLLDTEAEARSTNCSFVCDPGYEPDTNKSACIKASYSCGYEPKQCLGKNGTVVVDGTLSNHKWTRYCPNVSAPCNECETGYEPDGNGNCVEKNNYGWRCLGSCERRLQTNTPGSNSVECETLDKSICNGGCEWRNDGGGAKCIKESSDCGSYNSSLIGGDCIVDDSNCSNEEKPMCIESDPNKVGPVAHVKNSISANPMKVVAYINGKEYKASCEVSKGGSNSCSFSGEKLTPGDNYTIIIYPIYEDGSLGAKCNLEPSGVENRIDQRGWMGGSNVGGVRQGYIWNCEDESPRCAFNGSYCSRGTIEGLDNTPVGKNRECKGKGQFANETVECSLTWSCNGSCGFDPTGDDACHDMYLGSYSNYSKSDCVKAGSYVEYNSNGGIKTKQPCFHGDGVIECPSCSFNSHYNDVSCGGRTAHSCLIWTANSVCVQRQGNSTVVYRGSEADTACSSISDLKPDSCISSSSWGNLAGSNTVVGGAKCYYKAGASHARGCAAVYPNSTTPYNGTNWISGSDNTAGWISYCSNQKSQPACEAVKVASFCVDNCGPSGSPVHQYNLPGSNGPANVIISDCCEWR